MQRRSAHPSDRGATRGGSRRRTAARLPRLEIVGYWFHELAPDDLPLPQRLVRRWRANDRVLVLAYLRGGCTLVRYRAAARCRFAGCAQDVGRRDLTDGVFVWPEGLAHHVECHGVRLPAHVVAHVRTRRGVVPRFVLPALRAGLHDAGPWRRWARRQGACVDLRGWRRPAPAFARRLAHALERHHGPLGPVTVLLCRQRTRAVVARLANGALLVAQPRRGGSVRRLAGWHQWPMRR
jgi:hypothetical protein